eukprot:7464455-Lingulodinium_polyedra.AAC.1
MAWRAMWIGVPESCLLGAHARAGDHGLPGAPGGRVHAARRKGDTSGPAPIGARPLGIVAPGRRRAGATEPGSPAP